jgi:hypothetical protein
MKLLAIIRPRDGVDVRTGVARHAEAELEALWGLYREGFVREMYSPGGPGALLVIEASSVEEGHRVLSPLPLVANEIVAIELIELRPFSALQMLFSAEPPA